MFYLLRVVLIALLLVVLQPLNLAQAKIGVGIGTGKIVVDEELKPGGVYELPSITVLNTGTVVSTYKLRAAYHEGQPELRPPDEWFSFSPNDFSLQPADSQMVKIILTVPIDAKPDVYFAYIEASPTDKVANGETSVGIAAASKLYFTVSPSNFISGVWYRFASLWSLYEPWTTRIAIFFGFVLVLFFMRNHFSLQINLKKKK